MNNEAVGLDIGTDTIKIVHLKKHKKGIRLIKAAVEELGQYPMQAGEDEDSRAVRVIKGILKSNNIKARRVIPVIPKDSAMVNNIKLPPVPDFRIDELIGYEARLPLHWNLHPDPKMYRQCHKRR